MIFCFQLATTHYPKILNIISKQIKGIKKLAHEVACDELDMYIFLFVLYLWLFLLTLQCMILQYFIQKLWIMVIVMAKVLMSYIIKMIETSGEVFVLSFLHLHQYKAIFIVNIISLSISIQVHKCVLRCNLFFDIDAKYIQEL